MQTIFCAKGLVMKKKKKLLIFDLDGTLIDSVPDLASSVNYTLQKLGMQTYSEEKIRSWVGNGAAVLLKRALGDDRYVHEALEIFLPHYKENVAVKTRLYDGVDTTLATLHKRGYILSIVTNKPYQFIDPILQHLGIASYFSTTLGADSLERKKPDPEPLLYLIKKFNIKKYEALMIGDSKNDILAAHNAEIDSVAVKYGYNYGEDISLERPTYIIEHFETLCEILG